MGKLGKWALGMGVVLLAVGALVYANLTEILLYGIERAAERRTPVGPHQAIEWASGSEPEGRTAGERPPSIVLILADDPASNPVAT